MPSPSYDEIFGQPAHIEETAGELMSLAKSELSGETKARVEAHLEECPACRLELMHMRKAVVEEQSAWERGRAAVKALLESRWPQEAVHFEAIWRLMESRGLLGALPTQQELFAQSEMGFVGPAGRARSPIAIAVVSTILQAVIQEGLEPRPALDRVRSKAVDVLVSDAGSRADAMRFLDDFVLELETGGFASPR